MKASVIYSTIAAVVLFPIAGLAAEPDSTAPPDSAVSAPHNGVTLQAVIDAVAAKTRKHFLVSPSARGSIDVGALRLRDIDYPTFVALLSLNGYVVVETSNGVVVTSDINARQLPTRIYPPHSISALDEEWVTVVMPVKGMNASQLIPVLRPLMPQAAQFNAVVGRNALVIVDTAANVKRIVAIVEALEALPLEPARADQSPN